MLYCARDCFIGLFTLHSLVPFVFRKSPSSIVRWSLILNLQFLESPLPLEDLALRAPWPDGRPGRKIVEDLALRAPWPDARPGRNIVEDLALRAKIDYDSLLTTHCSLPICFELFF